MKIVFAATFTAAYFVGTLFFPSGSCSYVRALSPQGIPLRWDLPLNRLFISNIIDGKIAYYINANGSGDVSGGSDIEAVRRAFRTWEDVASSHVAFFDLGFTLQSETGADGINLIVWRQGDLLSPAIFASTTTTFLSDGTVIDTDLELNGHNFTWATSGEAGRVDVGHIVTHEIGHMLQLDHSPVRHATMAYSTYVGDTSGRDLAADDIAGISSIYPEPFFYSTTGSIEGRVALNFSPVFAAAVTAYRLDGPDGGPIGALTSADGSYLIEGLEPGDYLLRIDPVDASRLGSFYRRARIDFLSQLYRASAEESQADIIAVSRAQRVSGINFSLASDSNPDPFEPDDEPANAKLISGDGLAQLHHFSRPGDLDYVKFYGRQGFTYTLETANLGFRSDTVLSVYDSSGALLLENDNIDFARGDKGSRVTFTSPSEQLYYGLVRHFSPQASGGGTSYDLKLTETAPALAGRVTDAVSGSPLAGATLVLGQLRSSTNENGQYFFSAVEPGQGIIQVARQGYIAQSRPIETKLQAPLTVDFHLIPEPLPNLTVNGAAFNAGDEIRIGIAANHAFEDGALDLYGALVLPDGSVFFLAEGGSFKGDPEPLVRSLRAGEERSFSFNYVFSGVEPPGDYSFVVGFIEAGADPRAPDLNIMGLRGATFAYSP